MADGTKIEWTDATVNVVNGCSVISPGCTNCYAMRAGGRNLPGHPSAGLTQPSKAGHVWTGEVRFNERALLQPLRWRRSRRIFWNAHGDLFHDNVPDEWIDRCFAVCALTPQHSHQILTKRSARMREYMSDPALAGRLFGVAATLGSGKDGGALWSAAASRLATEWPLSNVWMGVSVEDQARRERVLDLAHTPAAIRFISGEPLLEGIMLTDIPLNGGEDEHGIQWLFNALTGEQYFIGDDGFSYSGDGPDMRPLDWVIVGGESGSGARPMHPDWARSLRDQCAAAGVPFLLKQWGDLIPVEELDCGEVSELDYPDGIGRDDEAVPRDAVLVTDHGATFQRVGKRAAGRLLDGVTHDGMPS